MGLLFFRERELFQKIFRGISVRRKTSLQVCVSMVCILMLTVVVLSGCASKNEESASKPEATKNSNTAATTEPAAIKSESGTVTIWGWDKGQYDTTLAAFNKKYPDIKVQYVEVAAKDYLKKIQTSVAAGTDLPDVVWGEAGFRGSLFELNVLENLGAAPYNFDKSKLSDYEIPLLQNSKGELVGLEQSGAPGALAYKRNLAKQYFGTDDPDQLSAMFPDWKTFAEKGKEVSSKSGGKVSMFGSLMDAYTILYDQIAAPIVDGANINTAEISKLFSSIQDMRDAKTDAKLDMWSPTWNASYAQDNVIFYPAASWSPAFVIKPNDKSSNGRWGLMLPPAGGYAYGGTSIGIWKGSKNKAAAWKYVEWLYGSDEGALESFKTQGSLIPLKSVFKNPALLSSGADAYFGGQDLNKFWIEKVFPSMKAKPVTIYDQDIYNASSLIMQAFTQDPKFKVDQALGKWEQELKKNHPEINFK
jgi:multiple sugar transport system substrate-binding protein